jgi:SAM-dependent methyltransferase
MAASQHRPSNARHSAPAAERNKAAIAAVLARVLPVSGRVVEIASGTGQHVVHFAKALPGLTWQPSEPDQAMRASIAGWLAEAQLANVLAPVGLDVCQPVWPVERAEAIVCINLIHIAPWHVTEALMAGAERLLGPGGVLFLYGPYRRFGRHTAPSNEAFDAQLRQRNFRWGVRDLEAVVETAERHGLELSEVVEMPANNLSVVFVRR